MAQLTLHLLGPPEVCLDGTLVTDFASSKVRALLFYLAVEADRAHRRESLAGLLWPDYPERSARTNLSNVLSHLRTTLSDREAIPPFFLVSRDAIQFNRESDHWVDVTAFEARVEGQQWEGAIELYRGRFLEGFSVSDSPPFEQWALVVRERAERQVMAALEGTAAEFEKRGDYARARDAARRQLEIEPWHESAHRALMRALALSGERASALAQYEACVQILKRELDVAPSAETTRLYEEIRSGVLASKRPKGEGVPPAPVALPPPKDILPPPSLRPTTPRTTPVPGAGERRLATALFVEMSGSAALLDDLGHKEWAERMAGLFQVLESEIDNYGGEVSEQREEGLVALFGVPVAHEDDAERAVLAALSVQEAVGRYVEGEGGSGPRLRVGVDTGELLVTHVQDERHVIGRELILARRAGIAAEPGTVLVGENAYRLVRPLFEWMAPEGRAAGGMYRPVARKALLGKGRGVPGLSSPLVGRDKELGILQEAVERVRAGVGGIVTLVGEVGIGKSRLVAEARKWADQGTSQTKRAMRDTLWVEGRCLSYAANVAYHLWLDVLHALLGRAPDAPALTVRAALAAQVGTLCPARFHEVYPYLCRLLSLHPEPVEGLPVEDRYEAARNARGESLRAEIFRGVEALIEGAARQQPLVVVCEDLHWADPTSLALLERLLALADRVPVLYICVFRPETEHGCWRIKETAAREYRYRHVDLRLDALSTAESEALVGHLLRVEDLPGALRTQLLEHAGGNPFYVEEILRALIGQEIIAFDQRTGRWGTTQEIEQVPFPTTLQGVLMARIDRLPADAKRTLQVASVIGRSFSYRLLAALRSSLPQGGEEVEGRVAASVLDAHLLTLQREQLIRERAHGPERAHVSERAPVPEREYIFHHVLTREAAYDSLLRRDRCAYHRQVAEMLERLFLERVEEHLGLLAYHWEGAEEIEKAVEYLLRAGEQARTAYANEEAVHYYRRALALLDGNPLGKARKDWRLVALRGLGLVYFGIGRVNEAEGPLREAIALGKEIGLPSRELVRLHYWLWEVYHWQAKYDDRNRTTEEGRALLGDDTESVAAALINLMIALESGWGSERFREFTGRTMQFLQRLPYSEVLRSPYIFVQGLCMATSKVEEAIKWMHILEEKATAHHDLRALAQMQFDTGDILAQRGDLNSALSQSQQALELFLRIGDIKHASDYLRKRAAILLSLGDLPRAQACARQSLEYAEAVGFRPELEWAHRCIGRVSLCQGDLQYAVEALQKAAFYNLAAGPPFKKAETSELLGRAYLAQGKRVQASRQFQEASNEEWLVGGRVTMRPQWSLHRSSDIAGRK